MRFLSLLLPFFGINGCSHMAAVESGIRVHQLAGTWQSERGDHLLIGCSGGFSASLADTVGGLPTEFHESGSHISEITEHGFTVSHWPLASDTYDVERWPAPGPKGPMEMRAEGMEWVQGHEIPCN